MADWQRFILSFVLQETLTHATGASVSEQTISRYTAPALKSPHGVVHHLNAESAEIAQSHSRVDHNKSVCTSQPTPSEWRARHVLRWPSGNRASRADAHRFSGAKRFHRAAVSRHY